MTHIQPYQSLKIDITELIYATWRGFSQVLLVANSFSGLVILTGITLFSPVLGIMTFFASIIGTLTGRFARADSCLIRNGIYGFNSVLSSITPILFLNGNIRWVVALLAAVLAALFMKVLTNILDKWNIPVLTVPFVLITWIGLLIAYRVDLLYINPEFVISSPTMWNLPTEGTPILVIGMIKGIGEVFVIDSLWTGTLTLVALFIAGWHYGLYAIMGALASWLTAYFIGVDTQSLNLGLYNYNAVLTMIAIGLVFNKRDKPTILVAMIAATLTVPVTAGLELLLDQFGLPALTFPFIICTWLFIGIRKFFPNI